MKRLGIGLLPLLGASALTFLVYGYSLSLSFMLDDFADLPRAASSPFFVLLTSAQGYSYYRPLAAFMEKLPYALMGRYDPAWYHLIPVMLHAVNGWLVYLLARRLISPARLAQTALGVTSAGSARAFVPSWGSAIPGRSTLPAVWAALFFLIYPLSYQVVPWVGALMHPLVVLLALGSLLAYYEGRRRQSVRWTVISFVLALMAPAAHENGVMVGPMVVVLEMFLWGRGRLPRPSRSSALFFVPGLVFLGIWWSVPRYAQNWTLDPDSLSQNALFLLQGLAYPVAGSLGAVSRWAGLPAEILAWACLPLAALVLGLSYAWRKAGGFFLLGLSWFAMAVLPAWALLSYAYVIDGPRLLYLASVPAALLWAGLWQLAAGRGRRALAVRCGLFVLTMMVVWQSWTFLDTRREMFEVGSRLVAQVVQSAPPEPGARVLMVNVPSWFNVKEPEYPIGHMGVTFLPDYLGLNRVVFMHRGFDPRVRSVDFPDLLRPLQYYYGPHGPTVAMEELAAAINDSDHVVLAAYGLGGVSMEHAGWASRAGSMSLSQGGDFIADFSGRLALVDARITQDGGDLLVELGWLSTAPVDMDLTTFVHVYDSDGRLIAQEDGYPLRGLYPIRLWAPGTLVHESRRLVLSPVGRDEGDYMVAAGVYDRSTGSREPASSQSGVMYPNGAVPVGGVHLYGGGWR